MQRFRGALDFASEHTVALLLFSSNLRIDIRGKTEADRVETQKLSGLPRTRCPYTYNYARNMFEFSTSRYCCIFIPTTTTTKVRVAVDPLPRLGKSQCVSPENVRDIPEGFVINHVMRIRTYGNVECTLWKHAVETAPDISRPQHNWNFSSFEFCQ